MTLQNGMIDGQRGFLWTDTAVVDPFTRQTVHFAPKAFQSQLFPAVASVTTVGIHHSVLAESVLERLPITLSAFLDACEAASREYVRHQPEIALCRLLVAAWCHETQSPRLFCIASDGGSWGKPHEAVEMDSYCSSGNRSAAYQLAVANGFTRERMLAIAEAQRMEPFAPDKGGIIPFHSIGGDLVEYEVTRNGVTSRVVKEWGPPVKVL